MPPKAKFTREEIILAALNLTREKGIAAVSARGLAARLGSSVKPIFGLFQSMEEVRLEVLSAAKARYQEYLQGDMAQGQYPPYKASGMSYIRFAREEPELFKLLFMRDRSQERIQEDAGEIKPLLELIKKDNELSDEAARVFHMEMWIYVHGIATMLATSYLDWDLEFISEALSDAYAGICYRFCGKEL